MAFNLLLNIHQVNVENKRGEEVFMMMIIVMKLDNIILFTRYNASEKYNMHI